jgi:hypothetical protein
MKIRICEHTRCRFQEKMILIILKGQSHDILYFFLLSSTLNLYLVCWRLWFLSDNFAQLALEVIELCHSTSMKRYN